MSVVVDEQEQATSELAQAIVQNRVSHAYLLVGLDQVQLEAMGIWFCQALFCLQPHKGYPCLTCNHCRRISQSDFPDVFVVTTDKKSLGIDEIRAAKKTLEQTGIESNHRVLLIKQADKLTTAAANSLLKFLEDPAGAVTTILLAPSTNTLLPTILSRTQVIHLVGSTDEQFNKDLHNRGYSQSDINIIQAAHLENYFGENDAPDHFEQLKIQAQSWFDLLLQQPQQAFVTVASKVLPIIENRSQQQIFMGLLEWHFSQYLNQCAQQQKSLHRAYQIVELFLHIQHLWQANVSFENSLEQLALKVAFLIKGS